MKELKAASLFLLALCLNTTDNCTGVSSITINPTTASINGIRTYRPANYDLTTGKMLLYPDVIFKQED